MGQYVVWQADFLERDLGLSNVPVGELLYTSASIELNGKERVGTA